MDSEVILRKLYRHRVWRGRSWRKYWLRKLQWLWDHGAALFLVIALWIGWMLGHVYYYNMLIAMRMQVDTARAQVDVARQHRTHVQKNIETLMRHYERYERNLMTDITKIRTQGERALPTPGTNAPGAAPGLDAAALLKDHPSLKDLLNKLEVTAEQYPSLRLTENVQQMSGLVMQTEVEIAKRISSYNDFVRMYATILGQFPANIFGKVMGFKVSPFYEIDPDSPHFQEVKP